MQLPKTLNVGDTDYNILEEGLVKDTRFATIN